MKTASKQLRFAFSRVLFAVLAALLACGSACLKEATAQSFAPVGDAVAVRSHQGFSDVSPSDWFVVSGDLDYVLDHGLLQGYGGTNLFGPYDAITRGQVAIVLWRIAGEPAVGGAAFDDVDYTQYHGRAILWARKTGVINGYGGTNRFGPDDPITREQLAVILSNFSRLIAHQPTASNCRALDQFGDSGEVSSWAREAMGWAVDRGIITGEAAANGARRVNPQGAAQRCAFAKMISVEHRDVLDLSAGGTLGECDAGSVYATGDVVYLSGYLEDYWWSQGSTGPQESFLLWLDDAATFNVETMGSFRRYENVSLVQVYENMGSLPGSVLNRRVAVVGTVDSWIGSIWQKADVILTNCTVVPLD